MRDEKYAFVGNKDPKNHPKEIQEAGAVIVAPFLNVSDYAHTL